MSAANVSGKVASATTADSATSATSATTATNTTNALINPNTVNQEDPILFALPNAFPAYASVCEGGTATYNPSTNAITANTFKGNATSATSASWASASISASYAPFTQTIQTTVASASWVSASAKITTSDTASYVSAANVSGNVATASFAISASYSITSITATATSSLSPYITLATSSLNWITCSFATASYVLNLTNTASYNFTASNVSTAGYVSDVLVYISHSATTGTSSFTFPSTWQNIGTGWPTTINAGTIATLWLRSIDTNKIIGTYNVSSSYTPSTASYAPTSSYVVPSAVGNGCFAYANFCGNASCTNNQTLNCTVTFISAGLYGVKFNVAASNAYYAVSFNGCTGSAAPTASIGSIVNPTTTNFSMSVVTGTSFIARANCLSGSLIVFGY